DARATFDRAMHRAEIGQVALHDLGSAVAQGFGAFILSAHQSAHLVSSGDQHFSDIAADGTDGASRAGHQDRVSVRRSHFVASRWFRWGATTKAGGCGGWVAESSLCAGRRAEV